MNAGFHFFFLSWLIISTLKVENVVYEPKNPMPANKVHFEEGKPPIISPSKNDPERLTKKVAAGKELFKNDSLFATKYLVTAPKKPPIATRKIFNFPTFLSSTYDCQYKNQPMQAIIPSRCSIEHKSRP